MYQNQLIINIRQDIEQLSDKNDLVRDSNTLNFTFSVTNPDGRKETVEQKNLFTDLTETSLEDVDQNNVFEINRIDHKEDPLIKVEKNEEIQMNLSIGGRNTEQYIIWACLNSRQVKVNGNLYNNIRLKKNRMGNAVITIENNMPSGRYELEVYGIPSPYQEERNVLKEVILAKRYTVEVR